MQMQHVSCLAVLAGLLASSVFAEEKQPSAETDAASEQDKLYKQFTEAMNGVKLVGKFTVLGKEDSGLREEEYTINSVSKAEKGDYWTFNTRIKYGKYDLAVPLSLEVKWAGDTPIITLTDLTIPVLGTFTSRVVIYNDKYAGTWTHGKVGGHLFGKIVKIEKEGDDS